MQKPIECGHEGHKVAGLPQYVGSGAARRLSVYWGGGDRAINGGGEFKATCRRWRERRLMRRCRLRATRRRPSSSSSTSPSSSSSSPTRRVARPAVSGRQRRRPDPHSPAGRFRALDRGRSRRLERTLRGAPSPFPPFVFRCPSPPVSRRVAQGQVAASSVSAPPVFGAIACLAPVGARRARFVPLSLPLALRPGSGAAPSFAPPVAKRRGRPRRRFEAAPRMALPTSDIQPNSLALWRPFPPPPFPPSLPFCLASRMVTQDQAAARWQGEFVVDFTLWISVSMTGTMWRRPAWQRQRAPYARRRECRTHM